MERLKALLTNDRQFTYALAMFMAALSLYGGVTKQHIPLLTFGIMTVIMTLGLRKGYAWARAGIVILFVIVGVYCASCGIVILDWKRIISGGCMLWYAWKVWHEFAPAVASDDSSSDTPPISLVLLLRAPRILDQITLGAIVSRAWNADYHHSDDQNRTQFVVGKSPNFVIKTPDSMFMLFLFSRPYWDETKKLVEDMSELRLRHVVSEHTAWLSVDAMTASSPHRSPAEYYPQIAKLVAELADSDCLGIYHPESRRINAWDDGVREKLIAGDISAALTPGNVPVVSVAPDDPQMIAAVATARATWPDFVAAYEANDGEGFSVKAPISRGGNTEFIWISIQKLDATRVHGTLGNAPVDLGGLKEGDSVTIDISDLNDWVFVRRGEPVGAYTARRLGSQTAAIHKGLPDS